MPVCLRYAFIPGESMSCLTVRIRLDEAISLRQLERSVA
jgi:hypothetical protein